MSLAVKAIIKYVSEATILKVGLLTSCVGITSLLQYVTVLYCSVLRALQLCDCVLFAVLQFRFFLRYLMI